jgi:PhoH-like ATPase
MCAKYLEENGGGEAVVVSKDINCRVKGDALGITTEDFEATKINIEELYKGWDEHEVSPAQMEAFYREGGLQPDWPAQPNQCFILRSSANPQSSAIGVRMPSGRIEPLRQGDAHPWGIKPLNVQQKFALELLLSEQVQLVTLVGGAGTGKTLLALAAGLQKVMDERVYSKVFVSRPIMPLGRDIGYLPGDIEEKLNPWMQPIYDNLELLLGLNKTDKKDGRSYAELVDLGFVEIEPLTYIRGRSIPNQFIIVDEAQNLTPHEVKTIITRAGESTKIVLTGDPYQIDNPYVDATSNGLTTIVQKFMGQGIAGHVTLTKGERSPLAELASNIL